MRRLWILAPAMLVVGVLTAAAPAQTTPVPFKQAKLIVETNATDGDAGVQVFLDHEPWRRIAVYRPDGRKIYDVRARGPVRDYGFTELFSESSEPPFTQFPIERFKKLFPEGSYTFAGTTVDGVSMRSSVRFTHRFPVAPDITAPADGATVKGTVVVRWRPAAQPAGVRITEYQVVVTRENPLRVLDLKLPGSTRQLTIPREFLQSETEYKIEVMAIEAGGNQTFHEVAFTTA